MASLAAAGDGAAAGHQTTDGQEGQRNGGSAWWQCLAALMVSLLGTEAQAAPFYASTDGSMVWDEATGLGWARCSLG